MADVVPVDCAPALSGWARAWTHVAVIIFYAAGAASVAPKGSTDCPLTRVFEAAAPATTSPAILYDAAPAVISGLLTFGYLLFAWSSWVFSGVGLVCLGFKWRAVLNGVVRLAAWVLSPSPPEFTHEDLKSRFD